MMRPPSPPSTMRRAARWTQTNAPVRLRSITCWKSSSGNSRNGWLSPPPALFTNTLRPPSSRARVSTVSAAFAKSVTSSCERTARRPCSCTSRAVSSAPSRSLCQVTPTSKPSLASRTAVALPMPESEPVMIALFAMPRAYPNAAPLCRSGEQLALADERHRERLVADGVEQQDDLVPVIALDHTFAPFSVRDTRPDGEVVPTTLGLAVAGVAVVAVAARSLKGLTEVAQDERTPAAVVLRVSTHHLEPRPIECAPLLGALHRPLDVLALDPLRAYLAVGPDLHRSDFLEPGERRGQLRLADLEPLAELGGIDGPGVIGDLLGHLLDGVAVHTSTGEEPPHAHVLRPVEEHGFGRLAVAPRAPDLLVVGVDGVARVVVEDEAYVRLVDPHAERGRGHDDVDVSLHERPLRLVAARAWKAGVVGQRAAPTLRERVGQLLGERPGRHVDDAGAVRPGGSIEQCAALVALIAEALDGQVNVRPIEPSHDDLRILHAEPGHDLVADRRRRRCGEREDCRSVERVNERTEAEVVGSEVMAPFRDAVRLVDHE